MEDHCDQECDVMGVDSTKIEVVYSDGSRRTVEGTFRVLPGQTLFLRTNERIPSSTAVCIEHKDTLFLGEVLACKKNPDASWSVRVKVEHTLTSLQSLLRLRSALLESNSALLDPERAVVLK